jgi:hypothetical protein
LVSGIAGDTQQACCLTFILWDTSAGEIERGQCACGALVARFGGTAVPACCFHIVRRQRTASDATIAHRRKPPFPTQSGRRSVLLLKFDRGWISTAFVYLFLGRQNFLRTNLVNQVLAADVGQALFSSSVRFAPMLETFSDDRARATSARRKNIDRHIPLTFTTA